MPGTEVQFDLPFGLEQNGQIHKTVTMRSIKVGDLIAVSKDVRVRELKTQGHELDMGSVQKGEDGKFVMTGKVDMVGAHLAQTAIMELHSVLFQRCVLRIGEIEKPKTHHFEMLHQADFAELQRQYEKINEVPDELKDVAAEARAPLGQ